MKKFRIVETGRSIYKYRVDQQHRIFFFFKYWDMGAYSLCPTYYFENREAAERAILNAVLEKNEK